MMLEEQDLNIAEQELESGSIASSSADQPSEYFFGSLDNSNRNQIARRCYKTEDVQVLGESICERPRIVYTNKRGGK